MAFILEPDRNFQKETWKDLYAHEYQSIWLNSNLFFDLRTFNTYINFRYWYSQILIFLVWGFARKWFVYEWNAIRYGTVTNCTFKINKRNFFASHFSDVLMSLNNEHWVLEAVHFVFCCWCGQVQLTWNVNDMNRLSSLSRISLYSLFRENASDNKWNFEHDWRSLLFTYQYLWLPAVIIYKTNN